MTRFPCQVRLIALALACACSASAESVSEIDWDAVADVRVIRAITQDEAGDAQETKVWLAVVDGQGFIRSGHARWAQHLQRDPEVVLLIEDVDYEGRVDFIEDEGLRGRVNTAFRDKYGWSDILISPIRGSDPLIMHIISR